MPSDLPADPLLRTRNATRSFWRLMHHVALAAAATHVMFVGLFFGLGAKLLAMVNVGSVALFLLSYLCLRARRNSLATVLILCEIVMHAVLAVSLIGWDSGFHYYLLLVSPIVFISRARMLSKVMMAGGTFVCYLALDQAVRAAHPYYVLQDQALSGLRYFNVASTFLLLSFLSAQYFRLVNQAEKQLRALATTDPLTRLLNRRSWLEVAQHELAQRHHHHEPLALVLADVDHFKAINDRHGHEVGDQVLQAVSDELRKTVRQQDSVARWGGEEFMVLMPRASLETARLVAERLRERIARLEIAIEGQAGTLTVSMTFGVSLHQGEEPIEAPVRRADTALYEGKSAGRNQVVVETAA